MPDTQLTRLADENWDDLDDEDQAFEDLIMRSSRDCIGVLDLDGTTLFVNQGAIDGMEITDSDSVLGKNWLRIWEDEHFLAAHEAVSTARAGGVGRFEGFCVTHRGSPRWWSVVISPVMAQDGTPDRLVAVARDISAQIVAQDRLSVSEEILRLAIEAGEIGIWHVDMGTGLLHGSDRLRTMLGPSVPDGIATEDFYATLHPDDRAPTRIAFDAAADPQRRASCDVEYRVLTYPDGDVRWIACKGRGVFDQDGRCLRVSGTSVEITARKAAEVKLQHREAELRAVNATLEGRVEARTRERDRNWNNSLDLLAVIQADGHVRAINVAWLADLGWCEADVVGRHITEFMHPEDVHGTKAVGVLPEGEQWSRENRNRHKDGGYRWIAWVNVCRDGLIYSNGRNITTEKEAAAELAAAQEKLRQSQKMEAVGQLTGGLAHDFNNLLAGISGSLELMQARLAQGRPEKLARYIVTAHEAATRAAALTKRLLAFSRRQTLEPQTVDVDQLVAGMADLVRRTVGPMVTIDVVAAEQAWLALVDPNQLENALLNLCLNARDVMPDGGRLRIATTNVRLDAQEATERELLPGQYISLCVTDNGTGMTPEVLSRAFDPFFSTKPLGQGTGLGLSMIYGFARQSGGLARITSELGHGTSVYLLLPRHLADAAATPELALPQFRGTILLVDDDPHTRLVTATALQGANYHTIEAMTGAKALRILQSDEPIDLLVSDVGLRGGMNGRQTADAGRMLRQDLKVLFITGYAEAAAIGDAVLEPGMQVLIRPFLIDDLIEKVSFLRTGLSKENR